MLRKLKGPQLARKPQQAAKAKTDGNTSNTHSGPIPTKKMAEEILEAGESYGQPLTTKQRLFFQKVVTDKI